jgi:hypothetical protein
METDSSDDVSSGGDNKKVNQNVELPQTFADVIGRLVSTKYEDLMVGNEVYARRKVLAGIVLTFGSDIKTAKVVAVTTGTKCISGEYISEHGLAVNDSHAEIVARRCFINFIYDQLELHFKPETAKDSIFLKPTASCPLYRLKDNIQFHLYINTAPCGDARVFSPHENDQALDKHPNRKARGQLRTKVESGEGTIPVKNCDGIQTWDGVLNVRIALGKVTPSLSPSLSFSSAGPTSFDNVVFRQDCSMECAGPARCTSLFHCATDLSALHCFRIVASPQPHVPVS